MMDLEIIAAKKYWHMKDDSIYDSIFVENRMVGNLGASDVLSLTWFGEKMEYVHGINL